MLYSPDDIVNVEHVDKCNDNNDNYVIKIIIINKI